MIMENSRKTEVFCSKSQQWIKIPPKELKKGDMFRMFELTGGRVVDEDKKDIFYAYSYPFLMEKIVEVYGIFIED